MFVFTYGTGGLRNFFNSINFFNHNQFLSELTNC